MAKKENELNEEEQSPIPQLSVHEIIKREGGGRIYCAFRLA